MASEYNGTTQDLLTHARNAMQAATNSETKIRGASKPNMQEARFAFTVARPAMQPPPSFGELFGTDTTNTTAGWLEGQVTQWLNNYFPTINGCLKTLPDEWLCDVIAGVKPFGYSQTYFDLVWHQARDRAYRTRRSETETIAENFSARGFTLPPGAMVAALDAAQQRASDAILEVNREQAIKDAEVKLELLKFAEEQALRYKLGVMQSLGDFYRQWSTLPDKDIEKARIRAQATASLYSALSSYYNVEVAFEQLRLRAAETKFGIDGDIDERRIKLFGTDNNANQALGSAVRGFADISAAAASAAGTLVAQIESI
jgi:hypothetical protein